MKIKTIELKELKAAKGMVLTNGVAYSSVNGVVYLGVTDSPENWYEITQAQYNEIVKEQVESERN